MIRDISIRELSQNQESVIVHRQITHFRAQMFLVFGPPLLDDLKLQLKTCRICLAGSGRDQLQSFGRGKKEQLLEERGCGPELLAASL